MSTTILEVFDSTLQKTASWLNEVMEETGAATRQRAYAELRAVLHALRDRLLPEEAVKLGAQLPMLVRGFYYEGWHLADKPLRVRHRDEFLDRVREELPFAVSDEELEGMTRGVFRVLGRQLSEGVIRHVRDELPEDIRRLWEVGEAAA
ncbi:MAG: DUF2267 domain-containing protein [Gammaproteobacteria bacterium]|nr:MAG: DUF2267 domain-containing protein [Gammaproteobacteria bacterium]